MRRPWAGAAPICAAWPEPASQMEIVMLDLVMLVVGLAFFVVAILYTVGCDRI